MFSSPCRTHGKDFHKIAAQLPGKTTANVVQHYYRWKKTGRVDAVLDRLTIPDDDDVGECTITHSGRDVCQLTLLFVVHFHRIIRCWPESSWCRTSRAQKPPRAIWSSL